MSSYTPEELRIFLEAVDRNLSHPFIVKIMGGSSIVLAYGIDRSTKDIDTFETKLRPLRRAFERAREETGLKVDVSDSSGKVGDVPEHSDRRMIRVLPELSKLHLLALEAHDAALSKALRGDDRDIAALRQLHEQVGLDMGTLVSRYLHEMNHVAGSDEARDGRFVELIEKLFGHTEAEEIEEMLFSRRRRRTPR